MTSYRQKEREPLDTYETSLFDEMSAELVMACHDHARDSVMATNEINYHITRATNPGARPENGDTEDIELTQICTNDQAERSRKPSARLLQR
jgi:hypothetical protein